MLSASGFRSSVVRTSSLEKAEAALRSVSEIRATDAKQIACRRRFCVEVSCYAERVRTGAPKGTSTNPPTAAADRREARDASTKLVVDVSR